MVISLIGSWIKQSDFTRPEICKEFGISQNTLSNWCNCKTFPSIPQALRLAKMLGVKVDDLYKLKEEE